MTDTLARMRQIVGTTADWAAQDLTLGAGEVALERVTGGGVKARIGDGTKPFSQCPYLGGALDLAMADARYVQESETFATGGASAANMWPRLDGTGKLDVSLVAIPPALKYQGVVNPTLGPPAGASTGDLYICDNGGVVDASWGAPAAGQTVAAGDWLVLNSNTQWQVVPMTVGIVSEAPADGNIYGRKDGGWADLATDPGGFVKKSGDTMTGNLGIGRAPTALLDVKGGDGALHFGVAGDTTSVRISCNSSAAAIEANDATLLGAYTVLSLAGSQVAIHENGTLRANFDDNVQFFAPVYLNQCSILSQFAGAGQQSEYRLLSNGNYGFRVLNTSIGTTLGRLVLQASTDAFSSTTGVGFTYNPVATCISPDADGGLHCGIPGYRFNEGHFAGGVYAATVVAQNAGEGYIQLNPSADPNITGHVALLNSAGTRQAFIGNKTAGGPINYANEAGGGHGFTGGDIHTDGAYYGTGAVCSQGATAMYQHDDRDGAAQPTWGFYAQTGVWYLWNATDGIRMKCDRQRWLPAADAQQELGTAGMRWLSVWASNGTIQTSDAREKRWRGPLTAEELAAARELVREVGIYQWLTALEEKGEAARYHVGILAQSVAEVMARHGLDAARYSFWCYDEWPEERHTDPAGNETVTPAGNRYSLRYNDLILFLMAAQEQRLAALEMPT
jgi:hypothetical protein